MDNFGTGQNPLQQFYQSFRLPMQQGGGGQQPAQGMGGQTPVPQQQPQQGGINLSTPIQQYLANMMTTAGNNSAMQSIGGFNNPGAQVGMNNINWDGGAAGGAGATAGGGDIMSMLAALL